MLWHGGYTPRVVADVPAPPVRGTTLTGEAVEVTDGVVVGAFDLAAQRDLGIWLRLLREAGGQKPWTLLLRSEWPAVLQRAAAASTAPGRHPRTILAEAGEAEWRTLVVPDRLDRGFAAIVRAGRVELLMVGPPTEEAWDDFRTAAQRRER